MWRSARTWCSVLRATRRGRCRRRSRARRPAPAPRPRRRVRAAPSSRDRLGALAEQRGAAELRPVVDQDHVGPELRGAQRGGHAGDAAADHEHVGVAAAVLGSPLALLLAAGEPAEAGGVAQHLLVERPQPARPDERLVVEAGRRQAAAEDVGRPHHVEVAATASRSCARPSSPRAPARCRRARRASRRRRRGSSGTGRRSRAARAGGGT